MFLKIGVKDNPIKGESTDMTGKNVLGKNGHMDWIEILSFKEAVMQPASPIVSSSNGRTKEKCHHDDFMVTKHIDLATPLIHQWCCAGTHIDKVILEMYRAEAYGTDNQPVLYMVYIMKDVIISSHSVTGTVGEIPIETVMFNYSLIYTRYVPQNEKSGSYTATPVGGGWDLVKNEPPTNMP
jgi:type VI secretion system Hcp family effector